VIQFPRIAQRFFNQPLALLPAHALLVAQLLREGGDSTALLPAGMDEDRPERRRYDVAGGVAVVPIRGCLVHGSAGWWWGETPYGAIRANIAAALGDHDVKAIALHVDSPGGEVAGCFDLADAIYAMRGEKPIWAILDESAYSAAYALASAADRIIVPRTGGTGSIGVVTMHVDITRALDEAGITVTTIQYGERKTDSYPTTKLSDPALARIQADIDKMGDLFVETAARNRGVSAEKIRDTEAGTFLGADGVAVGLADEVLSPDEAFMSLIEQIG
jgi:capsid assembly protease